MSGKSNRKELLTAGVVIIGILGVLALVTGIVSIPPSQPSNTPQPAIVTKSTCDRPPGFILIIADLSGFNDSIAHGAPLNLWPVIRVQRGEAVRLLVCNRDQTQPHGFAIQTYLDNGIPILPGDAYRIVFTATEPGSFRVYCNIFCSIHIFMVGQLIVSG